MRLQRLWVIVVIAVVAAASALLTIVWTRTSDESAPRQQVLREVVLPPLPKGPPRIENGVAEVFPASLEEMTAVADVIFVGRVDEVGGSEIVTPPSGGLLTRHRVRFAVVEVLRGQPVARFDVSLLDYPETTYAFEVGEPFLVFAYHRRLGSRRVPGLVPVSYARGVYRITDGEVTNAKNGTVNLNRLREEVTN